MTDRDVETPEERTYREAREDDLSTWDVEDNDVTLWPRDWNREPVLDGINIEFIPRELRQYYKRSAERDVEVLAEWGERQSVVDPSSIPFSMHHVWRRMVGLSFRRPGFVCHFFAILAADEAREAERRAEYEAGRDRTEFTCASCAVVDRADVRPRSVGAWVNRWPDSPGPRFCHKCWRVAELEAEDRRRAVVQSWASEDVDEDGTLRGDLVDLWITENTERIMES